MKGKKNTWRIALIVILAIVFVVCCARLIIIQVQYAQEKQVYEDAQREFLSVDVSSLILPPADTPPASSSSAGKTPPVDVTPPTDEDTPTDEAPSSAARPSDTLPPVSTARPDLGVDFAGLKALNSDIVGWIWIPDTAVNYPLLRCDDNNEYLRLNYRGDTSLSGSIFIEESCKDDLTSRNTIIYGHNMSNKTMFGGLYHYKDLGYAEPRRTMYIFLETGSYRYDIFSAYTTSSDSGTYRIGFADAEDYLEYLGEITSASVSLSPARELSEKDKIVTLSTCTVSRAKTERFVVHAVLEEFIPKEG